jgi:hypothetical protein
MRRPRASSPFPCILGLLCIALAASVLDAAQPETVLRISVQTIDSDAWTAAAERGVEFGIGEAAHTAALLGRRLELVAGTSASHRPAVVIGTDTISIRAGADATCEFRVDPSAERRQRALNAWRAQADEGDAGAATARAVAWHPALSRFGASELNERFTRTTGQRMGAPEWLGWVAVKALAEAFLRASPSTPVCDSLRSVKFDGHKGRPIRFDEAVREMRQTLAIVRDGKLVGEADPWSGGKP